jgi:protein O-GlcNAc transferase
MTRTELPPEVKPRIRILHQLARSGGTVICRCLASMENIVLLSEIHPLGGRMFNPLQQAMEWYGLLDAAEFESAVRERWSFTAAVALIAQRCAEQDKYLVLRDWSHLDYIGIPFTQARYRPELYENLQHEFDVIRYASVRHPLDQWLSLTKNPLFAQRLGPGKYLKGVRRFAEMASTTGFLHYEDFAADSDSALIKLCAALQLPFDQSYQARWASYSNITGDVLEGRSDANEIKPLPRQSASSDWLHSLSRHSDYQRILDLLAYEA